MYHKNCCLSESPRAGGGAAGPSPAWTDPPIICQDSGEEGGGNIRYTSKRGQIRTHFEGHQNDSGHCPPLYPPPPRKPFFTRFAHSRDRPPSTPSQNHSPNPPSLTSVTRRHLPPAPPSTPLGGGVGTRPWWASVSEGEGAVRNPAGASQRLSAPAALPSCRTRP